MSTLESLRQEPNRGGSKTRPHPPLDQESLCLGNSGSLSAENGPPRLEWTHRKTNMSLLPGRVSAEEVENEWHVPHGTTHSH